MKYRNDTPKSKRLKLSILLSALCLLPIQAQAERLTCLVDSVLAADGHALDSKTSHAIKDIPLIVDVEAGTVEHPVWGTDKFKETELVEHHTHEGQTVILAHNEAGKLAQHEDVDFMFDIETQASKISAFIIAAKVPTSLFAQGHCTRIDEGKPKLLGM